MAKLNLNEFVDGIPGNVVVATGFDTFSSALSIALLLAAVDETAAVISRRSIACTAGKSNLNSLPSSVSTDFLTKCDFTGSSLAALVNWIC